MSVPTSFRFTSEPPSAQLFQDVQNLNAFTADQLDQFLAVALAFLAHEPRAADGLADFARAHGVNMKPLRSTVRGLLFFFSEALRRNMSAAQVRDDLAKLGLGEEKAAALSAQWARRFVALSESAVAKTLKFNQLLDMEWKFGVTASTDELAQVGTCFLQLKLVLDKGAAAPETVVMELTLPQFYQFLSQMQAAAKHAHALAA